MIEPGSPDFNFDSYSKFVINASELANKDLAELLYSQPNNIPQALMQEVQNKDRRSRNSKMTLNAGQSVETQEFFKAKPIAIG